mmetsp:Transcript_42047/g.118901  ORF Transcript_42047/g.118901 Transcript_42047/m.118901 type:complete len:227 (+) Transcript_42047:950-1630(+)
MPTSSAFLLPTLSGTTAGSSTGPGAGSPAPPVSGGFPSASSLPRNFQILSATFISGWSASIFWSISVNSSGVTFPSRSDPLMMARTRANMPPTFMTLTSSHTDSSPEPSSSRILKSLLQAAALKVSVDSLAPVFTLSHCASLLPTSHCGYFACKSSTVILRVSSVRTSEPSPVRCSVETEWPTTVLRKLPSLSAFSMPPMPPGSAARITSSMSPLDKNPALAGSAS